MSWFTRMALRKYDEDQPRDEQGRFASASVAGEDAHHWLSENGERQHPKISQYDMITSPLRKPADGDLGVYAAKKPGDASDAAKAAPVQKIRVDDIVSGQQQVEGARLKEWNADAPPVEIMKWKGTLWLTEGNHRASAAWAAGVKEIDARVLDLDDKKNQKYLKPKFREKS